MKKEYNFTNKNTDFLDQLEFKLLTPKIGKIIDKKCPISKRLRKLLRNSLRSRKTITLQTKEEIEKYFENL